MLTDRIDKAITATEIAEKTVEGKMILNYLTRIKALLLDIKNNKRDLTDEEVK
jgi:hypothetical protein